MLVGRSVEDIISEYGHDGSAAAPGLPHNRLCFTDLETIKVAFRLGVHLVPFSPYSRIAEGGVEKYIPDQTFKHLLERYSGILVGNWIGRDREHSVCWSNRHSFALDPATPEAVPYGHLYERWNVDIFLAWVNPYS